MKHLIKKLLREGLEVNNKNNMLKELFVLLEKEIEVGKELVNRLSIIQTPLSRKILNFLNSNNIKKDSVEKVYYDKEIDDGKKITVVDDRGGERNFRIGKFLSYLGYPEEYKSHEIEAIINNLKRVSDIELNSLKLISGNEIKKVFSEDCIKYKTCMKGMSPNTFDIFAKNPDQVKALVMFNPETNDIVGRALVWLLDNGKYFMDEVYFPEYESIKSDPSLKGISIQSLFFNYARKNNYERVDPSDDVTLENGGWYDKYPYMDTFSFYNPITNKLSQNGGMLDMTATNGMPTFSKDYLNSLNGHDIISLLTDENFGYALGSSCGYENNERRKCWVEALLESDAVEQLPGEYLQIISLLVDNEEFIKKMTPDCLEILLSYEDKYSPYNHSIEKLKKLQNMTLLDYTVDGEHIEGRADTDDVIELYDGKIVLKQDARRLISSKYANLKNNSNSAGQGTSQYGFKDDVVQLNPDFYEENVYAYFEDVAKVTKQPNGEEFWVLGDDVEDFEDYLYENIKINSSNKL